MEQKKKEALLWADIQGDSKRSIVALKRFLKDQIRNYSQLLSAWSKEKIEQMADSLLCFLRQNLDMYTSMADLKVVIFLAVKNGNTRSTPTYTLNLSSQRLN